MARLNPFSRKHVHRFSDRAAAHTISSPGESPQRKKQMHTELDAWQRKILNYSGIVPEVMTGYSFVHNVIDRVTFEIERFDKSRNEWVRDETPAMQGIERRVNNGFRAGRTAALMHLIEEAFVLVSKCDSGFHFETLAPTEIRYKSNRNEKRVLKDGVKDDWVVIGDDVTIIRIYTPDPANRHLAGGPHKSLITLLETMAVELNRDQSNAINVLAGNGILFIPEEILPDIEPDLSASKPPQTRSYFEDRLEEAMISPITDLSRAELVVPITIYGPSEFSDKIRHIKLQRDSANDDTLRMDKYVERYAKAIDLPAQVIEGLGDTNHWTDWKVDENTWAYHLEPRAQRIGDAIYDGLVGRIIHNLGLDCTEYRLVPNPSKAVAKQDQSGNATDAYKLGALKSESYIEALGFDPSDMRDDAEETLLDIIASNLSSAEAAIDVGAPPDRTAAGVRRAKSPETILRGASNIANQQQNALDAFYRRILRKVGEDAALAGRQAKRLRARAEKQAASDPVTFEGYEPGVYFEKYRKEIERGTNEQLFKLLRRIATLCGLDYGVLKSIWSTEFEHRAKSVARAAETEAKKIERASFKSGKAAQSQEAWVRTLTSIANGGANNSNGKAGNTERPTHAAADPVIPEALNVAVGSGGWATEYEWIHDEPLVPFPPHVELNGRKWFSWQEGDALDHPNDTFPVGNTYFPGDHDGCRCEYKVRFVPISETEGA